MSQKVFYSISTNSQPTLLAVKVTKTEAGGAVEEMGAQEPEGFKILIRREVPNFQKSIQDWTDWQKAGLDEIRNPQHYGKGN